MTEYRKAQIICGLLAQGTCNDKIKSEFARLLRSGYIIKTDNRVYAINKQ